MIIIVNRGRALMLRMSPRHDCTVLFDLRYGCKRADRKHLGPLPNIAEFAIRNSRAVSASSDMKIAVKLLMQASGSAMAR